jgi:hypothetical protein
LESVVCLFESVVYLREPLADLCESLVHLRELLVHAGEVALAELSELHEFRVHSLHPVGHILGSLRAERVAQAYGTGSV